MRIAVVSFPFPRQVVDVSALRNSPRIVLPPPVPYGWSASANLGLTSPTIRTFSFRMLTLLKPWKDVQSAYHISSRFVL